jgi:lysine-N-methylase
MVVQTVLIPQYMQRFSCSGSACEDTCCSSWQIHVDRRTYEKYKSSEPTGALPSVLRHLQIMEPPSGDERFAHIQLNEDRLCPMLNQDKLCSIHLQFGEEHLSNLCVAYPRVTNILNGMYEKSATISCPEAARLVLLNPDGIKFEEIREAVDENRWEGVRLDTRQPSKPRHKYFLELRTITMEVLQNRIYPLQVRLLSLCLLFDEIKHPYNSGAGDTLLEVIESFRISLQSGEIAERLTALPVSVPDQMRLLRKSIDMRLFAGVDHKRYLQCIMESLEGLAYTGDKLEPEIIGLYQGSYEAYYKPFMAEHEYILENYLVNNVFKQMFPSRKDIFEEWMMHVVHYALIKFHLIGMMNVHKQSFTTDSIIKLIQSYSRNFEHAPAHVRQFLKLMQNSGQMNVLTASILIQNESLHTSNNEVEKTMNLNENSY